MRNIKIALFKVFNKFDNEKSTVTFGTEKSFSIDRSLPLSERINFLLSKTDYKKHFFALYLSERIVVKNSKKLFDLLRFFIASDKKIAVIKDTNSGIRMKGFFRIPNFIPDLLIFKGAEKFPKCKMPSHFYNDEQESLVIRKYLEENFTLDDIYFLDPVLRTNKREGELESLNSNLQTFPVYNCENFGFILAIDENIFEKEIEQELLKFNKVSIFKLNYLIASCFRFFKRYLFSYISRELNKKYEK